MNAIKMAAIVLIVAGVLGLAYGSFSYTKETHEAKLGPLELSVKDKETVNVPVWAGVGAIVIGGLLLTMGRNTRRQLFPRSFNTAEQTTCQEEEEISMNMHLSIGPLVSLIAGILILMVPRLLNYIVAIY